MYRVLALCVLMALGAESIRNRVREVKMAEKVLLDHLVEKDYETADKDLQYLLLISAVYYPALIVANSDIDLPVNVKELYLRSLDLVLPGVEADPNRSVKELKYVVNKNAAALSPLVDTIDKNCGSLSDDLCNELLKELLASGTRPDLEKSVAVLDKAHAATKVYLEKNPLLEKLAETLNVKSYLRTNPKAESHILVLANWLRAVVPKLKFTF